MIAQYRFDLPGTRLISEANARDGWRAKARRAKRQRFDARMLTRATIGRVRVTPPFAVRIERVGKRRLDQDNLANACKAVQDGIADALGVDDGDMVRIMWRYEQSVGSEYRVHVTIDCGVTP